MPLGAWVGLGRAVSVKYILYIRRAHRAAQQQGTLITLVTAHWRRLTRETRATATDISGITHIRSTHIDDT